MTLSASRVIMIASQPRTNQQKLSFSPTMRNPNHSRESAGLFEISLHVELLAASLLLKRLWTKLSFNWVTSFDLNIQANGTHK